MFLSKQEEKKMEQRALVFITIIAVLSIAISSVAYSINLQTQQQTQQPLAFSAKGTNTCLRFLDRNVSTCYIPFTTSANERLQLSINASKIPGSGWTDVFVYNGYWDKGKNHTCLSQDLYPILNEIQSSDFRIQTNSTFTKTFVGSTTQSYTFFIIFPAGGESVFNFKLEKTS
jgi:hypothetical protein